MPLQLPILFVSHYLSLKHTGGAYVGIIDTATKAAVALFRVTEYNLGGSPNRSVHMSFWLVDGSGIVVANLHGKAIERINLTRDSSGTITKVAFDRSASLGLGQDMAVSSPATFFKGQNAFGDDMLGEIEGLYSEADLGDRTYLLKKLCSRLYYHFLTRSFLFIF